MYMTNKGLILVILLICIGLWVLSIQMHHYTEATKIPITTEEAFLVQDECVEGLAHTTIRDMDTGELLTAELIMIGEYYLICDKGEFKE